MTCWFLRCTLGLVFVVLILPGHYIGFAADDPVAVPAELHAGTPADPWTLYNSATVSVAFDNTYTGVQITRVDVQVHNAEGVVVVDTAIADAAAFPIDATTFRVPIRSIVEPLPNEALYRVLLRVYDANGNVSDWSQELWVRKWWTILPPPSSNGGGCLILR